MTENERLRAALDDAQAIIIANNMPGNLTEAVRQRDILRTALAPFARLAEIIVPGDGDEGTVIGVTVGDLRRVCEALAALAPAEGMGGDPFRTVATALLAEEEKERRMGWTLQLGWYVLAFEKLREAFMASSIDHLPPGHVVLEQADNLQGTISQTVRRPDGSEYERRVDADEAAPTTTREDEPEEDNWLEDPDMGAR